jgi:hypothetical protein
MKGRLELIRWGPKVYVPDKVEYLTKEELLEKYGHLFSKKELEYLGYDKTRSS